jgi:type I restriction-modification system DNA methylase subunit
MLLINADREYREGRAQNFIDPEHIEKIVSAYDGFRGVPGLLPWSRFERSSRTRPATSTSAAAPTAVCHPSRPRGGVD